MNVPLRCPVCQDPLLHEFGIGDKSHKIWKTCSNKIGHKIEYFMHDTEDKVRSVTIQLTQKARVSWLFDREIVILSQDNNNHTLPWFEPDLSQYRKLVDKIKTYIVFS